MTDIDNPKQNQLLAALPEYNFAVVSSHLEPVEFSSGEVLCEPGREFSYVYFPATCIISNLNLMANGNSSELAMIGNEGMVGISLFMGGGTMLYQVVAISLGCAYRMQRKHFEQEIKRIGGQRHGALHGILLRYILALITHITQLAACNRHHSIDQQLCRWLLMILDRQNNHEIAVTQQTISSILGVRREGITEAAGKLQQAGLIRYKRGHISILDRAGLEAQSCECYQVIKAEFVRLLAIQTNPPPQKHLTEIMTCGHPKHIRSFKDKPAQAVSNRLTPAALPAHFSF